MKKKLCWLTDLHLNFVRDLKAKTLSDYIGDDVDGLIITGDISDATYLEKHLYLLSEIAPIYFVLGNHDYYSGSFASVDKLVLELQSENHNIHWLRNNPFNLSDSVVLVGSEGWYDARYGNAKESSVALNDWTQIEEIRDSEEELLHQLRKISARMAGYMEQSLKEAGPNKETIVVATHVSPYRESCWYRGQISNNDWLPWFTSKAMGDVIDKYVELYKDTKFIVLSGHSHSSGVYRRDRLTVYSGAAEYWHPENSIAGYFDVDKQELKPT